MLAGWGEVERLQKGATVAWQGPQSGRPPSKEQRINIREKISQWEVLSQQSSSPSVAVKAHTPPVSPSLSGDQHGNGFPSGSSKPNISKVKTLALDFRECSANTGHLVGFRKSEPLQRPSTGLSPTPQLNKQFTARTLQFPKVDNSTGNQTISTIDAQKIDCILDVEAISKPLPLSTDDLEDNMPAGNFYTSRGFWRKLEGDRLLWEKGRGFSGGPQAPPKPQRTFQYSGPNNHSGHTVQLEKATSCVINSDSSRRRIAKPPNFPPPPHPGTKTNGLTRHKKNRKSFEYEDAARLTGKQGTLGVEARRSGLYHAYSDDSIYEDIACDVTRDDPYEDVKHSPMCLPTSRPKLPPKPQTLQGYGSRVEWKNSQATSKTLESPKPVAPPCSRNPQRTLLMPQYVSKIETIFDDKRGRKRVKNQGVSVREETSGTESDPEDNTKAGSRRSVYIQSTLKRRPGYRTLERDLIQLQQQQLFQIFVVVSLRKSSSENTYSPEITQQFPKMFEKSSRVSKEAEDQLKVIPKFCFPDSLDWKPSAHMPSETFSFVLTGEDGSRWFCYCRKILPSGRGKRLPEVHCIVSKLGCFNLFAKILEEVERRREISPALVYPFMRSVMEAPFPAPGRTVTVKSFLPGSGNEVLTLCRPVDSRLEHVDFNCLLQCLSVGRLLQVFASVLLERRVIFIADKLSVLSRCGHAALALLYPFTWQHTFIPVLPASMLDISCSPTPFVIGVLAPCLPQLLELPIEEVLIVDLCADKFEIQMGDEDCILPSKLQAALQQILEDRDYILSQEDEYTCGDQEPDLSSLVSEGFVRFFVELVGHYPLHMVESSNGGRELQRDSFRKSHPSRGVRQFLQLFMDTQMFAGFIQDKELRKSGGRGLFEARVAEYMDSYPEPEPSGVNKFLKGLGNKMKLLQIK
ncbi:DENN domain-containing protein 2C [Cynoglossus semilaevis]|uniref:DENN domain containing 2C n=1 Tax=Cynoglossus semilaevis TaxID=244447 RepID=A0A3P8UTR8_CYNSE|nr:DENN domain-containing protein 2C [Cynoglossus semilaevis]